MSRLLVLLADAFFGMWNWLLRLFGRVTVPEVSAQELIELLEAKQPPVVLVDIREPAEYSVSVIPGAITRDEFESRRDELRGARVVAYCTVGGRSFMFSRALRKQGFDAWNFKPSIIGWCEAGQSLVTVDGQSTTRVHTYSSAFTVPAVRSGPLSRTVLNPVLSIVMSE